MLKMDHANMTQAMFDAESHNTEKSSSNEYFYILIVMSFYGIFLIGIMLAKNKENIYVFSNKVTITGMSLCISEFCKYLGNI
uniref:Uncharacterized protein n=1 Tax=Strix occidentalis caurina TaxID=311401 RepID=A0A8D0FQB1_STROC